MPWPTSILREFHAIPGGHENATTEALFYGPYTSLMKHLFPSSERFMVYPQFQHPHEHWSIDFTAVYIFHESAFEPVFFLEIKPPYYRTVPSTRVAADDQMRRRFSRITDLNLVKLPIIHGVSALGTHLSFYSLNRDTDVLDPPAIPPPDDEYTNDVPAEQWNIDLLSEEGMTKMTQVVNEVKAMVAQYPW